MDILTLEHLLEKRGGESDKFEGDLEGLIDIKSSKLTQYIPNERTTLSYSQYAGEAGREIP